MTVQTWRQRAVAMLGVSLLAACSASDGDTGVAPVFADGTPLSYDSFVGKTFALNFATGVEGPQGTVVRREAQMRFVDDDTIELSIVGTNGGVYQLDRIGNTLNFESVNFGTLSLTETAPGVYTAQNVQGLDGGDIDLLGVVGFETGSSRLPNSAVRYNENSTSALFISSDNEGDIVQVNGNTVDVIVDFASGNVTGRLFEGSANTLDGELGVSIDIANGNVSGSTVTGNITGDMDLDGTDLNPIFTNSSVDAAVFGNNGEVLAGVYGSEFSRDPAGGGTRINGDVSGYFDATAD